MFDISGKHANPYTFLYNVGYEQHSHTPRDKARFEDAYRECKPMLLISFPLPIEFSCTYRQRADTKARHSRYVTTLAPLCFYDKDPTPSRRSRLTNSVTVLDTFRSQRYPYISWKHAPRHEWDGKERLMDILT